ncbi:MAG: N-acetyltransferase [Alphaproteobacteria bacterium]|nr:N-acetyltransferase [Alphaproteobacteria bacterium]
MDGDGQVAVRVVERIGAIAAADWDACAGRDNPFLSHAFLAALEESGSVAPDTGWLPQHLVAEDESGRVLGVVPAYLKSHSQGEYVFDHGWADAYMKAGGRYYPKLQIAVPFTPATGRRFLLRPGVDADLALRLAQASLTLAEKRRASSVHVTFPTEAEWSQLGEAGWLRRTGLQFHWTNEGYRTFEDFLEALSSRKRKVIRKERREVAESGIVVRALSGSEIEERHWRTFHRYYLDTVDRKWAHAYLNEAFFLRLGATMADRVVMVVGEAGGKMIAGALNLLGADALYGRNWGADGAYRFLHFEACYYRAIDVAIERGLMRVEAGAQGPHKIQRGYLPTTTYSLHHIFDPRLAKPVADVLTRERVQVTREIERLKELSPFRKGE